MRAILIASCAAALAGCSSMVTQYGPQTVMTAGGYRDAAEGPNRWRVGAKSNGFAFEDFAQAMAMFRGAVLAKAAGFSYLQIVYFQGTQRTAGGMRGIQDVTFRFVGVNDPAAPLNCESPPLTQSSCRTVGVDETLALLADQLERTPAQVEAEVAAARASPPREGS
jgi:hypothetical protein